MGDQQSTTLVVEVWRQPKPLLWFIRRRSVFAFSLVVQVKHFFAQDAQRALQQQLTMFGWEQDFEQFSDNISAQRFIASIQPYSRSENVSPAITVEQLYEILHAPVQPEIGSQELKRRMQSSSCDFRSLLHLVANAEEPAVRELIEIIDELQRVESGLQHNPTHILAGKIGIEVKSIWDEGMGRYIYRATGTGSIELPSGARRLDGVGTKEFSDDPADIISWERVKVLPSDPELLYHRAKFR